MKQMLLLVAMNIILINTLQAQNVGIGTTEPLNKLQVAGNLLVNTPTAATGTAPTVAQTKTMVNSSTTSFVAADSTGRIYDPGGPSGNYLANLLGFVNIGSASGAVGIEITVESMQLGTGDSLIIKETASATTILLAVGNGYTTTGKWVFNTDNLHLTFKSNADASVGSGFSLLYRRLYDNTATQSEATGITGKALLFDTKTGSFRTGLINNAAKGSFSTALGYNITASGDYSTAFGISNTASGDYATAMGIITKATGFASTAMGYQTTASGDYATAMGRSTTATVENATAMGFNTDATGSSATAMGRYTRASGYASTAIGDSTLASGRMSFASGYESVASVEYATAMGFNTDATGSGATAMGRYTRASGFAATAIGDSTLASGSMAFASGFETTASGRNASAMGEETIASGINALAMGERTTASGERATAMGFLSNASGDISTAMGFASTASGNYSTSMGSSTIASGRNSTAMGENTVASGNESTAMGYFATASGDRSTAMGSYVSTNNHVGSFIIGDYSTSTILNSTLTNSFRARFDGGYRFFTSSAASFAESCSLFTGSNAWSTTSDARLKENFELASGEDFLQKIAAMPLGSWNYKKQNPQSFRHYGPMAQDFFAAFGKDKYGTIGNDTTINSADFDGVNLIAIQALEKRTQKMQQLETDNARLQKELDDLKTRLQKLEAVLQKKQL